MTDIKYKDLNFTLEFKEYHPPLPASFWITDGFLESYKKISGTDVGFIYHLTNSEMTGYMESEGPERIYEAIKEKISKDWIDSEIIIFDQLIVELKTLVERFRFKDLKREELVNLLDSLTKLLAKLYPYSNIFYLLSIEIEKRVSPELIKNIQPIKDTFLIKFSIDINIISKKLKKEFGMINEKELKELYIKNSEVKKQIEKLRDKYFCLTSLNAEERTTDSFILEIISELKKSEVRRQKFSKLSIEDENIYLLRAMLYFKDELSTFAVPFVMHGLSKQFDTAAKLLGLSRKDLDQLVIDEVIDGLKSDRDFSSLVNKRKEGTFLFHAPFKSTTIIDGIEAKKEIELLNQQEVPIGFNKNNIINGKTGSSGKVTGSVQLIFNSSEIKNFKEGNILVAVYTAPEFVPAMRRAKAIITDTGGITCHAAIVSRELGLPCVVGTKIATKVLKDGDLVKVDADKGVVRKLS